MTLDSNGWIDWADRSIPGHPAKVYSQKNSCKGFACHSVTGDLAGHVVPDRFTSDARVPGQPGRFTDYAAASVQFILYKDGHLRQLYPIYASTWTSGGPEANTSTMSMEAEGGYSPTTEKLTLAQEDSFCRLMKDLEPVMGVANPGTNIWQHKELAAMYGYPSTECASDRYSNAWARAVANTMNKEIPMTTDEKAAFDSLKKEHDELLLAMFSGAEEGSVPLDTRKGYARYRLTEFVDGSADGVKRASFNEQLAELAKK